MNTTLDHRTEIIETGKGCLFILAALGALGGIFVGPFVCLMVLNLLLLNPVGESAAVVPQVRATVESEPPVVAESLPATPTTAASLDTTTPTVFEVATVPPASPTEAVNQASNTMTVTLDYDPARVATGETGFASLCAACHGPDARGLPGLGLDLVQSEFVHGLDDPALLTFIKTGRPIWDPNNTTGIDMPPRGGNPALSDEDILSIIAYLRTLAATNETAANGQAALTTVDQTPTVSAASPTEAVIEESGTDGIALDYDPSQVAAGETGFASLCAACHGPDARGLPNLGLDLVQSEFVHALDDQALLTFIKTGRPIWDPNNTTGVDMPPRGGNPALSDEDILSIIAYLRTVAATGTP